MAEDKRYKKDKMIFLKIITIAIIVLGRYSNDNTFKKVYINTRFHLQDSDIFIWKGMISVPDEELMKISEEFVRELKALNQCKDWKVKEEKPTLVWEKKVEERVIVKASLTINLPFEQVLTFFSDPNLMKIVHDNVNQVEVIYDNKTIKVIHAIMKMPGPVSDREVVAVNTVKIEGKKAYVGNKSCKFPFNKHPDTVIAELHAAGFILEKIEEGKTNITNISDVDIKGSIPGFVQNTLASKRVQVLLNLQEKIKQTMK